jgi:hypothetical protein
MRWIQGAAPAPPAASAVAVVPVAMAATGASSGKIKVFASPMSATKDTIILTGSIGDYGTAISTNKQGKVSANGSYERLALKQGTFIVNATKLDQKAAHVQPTLNAATCSYTATIIGPTTLGSGTGAYQGISGTVKITLMFAGIAPRSANGKCNLSNSAKQLATYQSISGVGTVKLP